MVRQELPGGYEGREQAFIKHALLEAYLQKLFLIVGHSNQRKGTVDLCYVDCFAGPWGSPDEDLTTTSIAISLATLKACREQLAARHIFAKIRALYVEERPRRFARLKAYLAGRPTDGIHAEAMHGDFVQLLPQIAAWPASTAFTFFFVDPKGWKDIGIPNIKPLLARPLSEFLITFMYNDVNRTMSMMDWQPAMRDLLGKSIDLEGLEPWEREREIVTTYRESCKACMWSDGRSAYVRVMDPRKERPKYHLVYLTSHPKGVVEFIRISEKLDIVQRRVRARIKRDIRIERSRMSDLFQDQEPIVSAEGNVAPKDVDAFWKSYLATAGGSRTIDIYEFADILERTDWFEEDLQQSLVRLIDARQISNPDASKKRPKKPLHFEMYGGEMLRLELPS